MEMHPLIDIQLDRGTATNQVVQWNDTAKRWEATLTPSGLTSIGVTGTGTFGSLITGSDIGVAGDADLLQLAADSFTVNGDLTVGVDSLVVDVDAVGTNPMVSTAGNLTVTGDTQTARVGLGTAPNANHLILGRSTANILFLLQQDNNAFGSMVQLANINVGEDALCGLKLNNGTANCDWRLYGSGWNHSGEANPNELVFKADNATSGMRFRSESAGGDILFQVASTTRMTLDSVGFLKLTPAASSFTKALVIGTGVGDGHSAYVIFPSSVLTGYGSQIGGGRTTGGQNYLTFLTGGNSQVERLRIDNDGLVTVSGDLTVGGNTSLKGNLTFVGVGGLLFGQMSIPGVDIEVTTGDANPHEVSHLGTGDGWAVGELNEVTFGASGSEHLLKATAIGRWKIIWQMSAHTDSGGGTAIHGGVRVNGAFLRDCGEGHTHVGNFNDDQQLSGVCVVDITSLAGGNDEISLWIQSDNNQDVHVEHGDMYIEQVGGT